ncbi:MAG: hypothetical protein OXC31_13470 [Spirochaetaceae bacterium]|nr:hypothetical protein [Spirochaetaceae bacterium]
MFQLIRTLSASHLLARQLPVAGVAFLTATLFYKFGNFALECAAFLATWFVLDAIVQGAVRLFAPAEAQAAAPLNSD